jgi:hypothetical protein
VPEQEADAAAVVAAADLGVQVGAGRQQVRTSCIGTSGSNVSW